PGRVREVPLCRRRVREGLDRSVGIAERRGEVERQLAGGGEPLAELFWAGLRIRPGHEGSPATKRKPDKVKSSLNVPRERLFVARRAWPPEHVAALLRRDIARSDEQEVRQAVEVSEQLGIERLA